MAGQLLAAQLIPSLGITGLAAIPPGKLASHLDVIRVLFHHQHYNFQGFNGLRSVCCIIDRKTKKGRCHDEGDPTTLWCDTRASCLQLGSPCLLAKVKTNLTIFVLLSHVMLYFTENFDEWNWPERTRSLSCSSLQVEILSGKNYFFSNAHNFVTKSAT